MNVDLEAIRRFLFEDIGSGDVTARIVPEQCRAEAVVVSREDIIVCGHDWFNAVFAELDPRCEMKWLISEGEWAPADSLLCRVTGPARALLTGERTALNLLQTLSGTATTAHQFAVAVAGTSAVVLDTRKTIPGLRRLQKYAVKVGGCENHRFGLDDGILIKENHIVAAGSIDHAVQRAKAMETGLPVEVEVESLVELEEAMKAGADLVLLDNFSLDQLRDAVSYNAGRVLLEASGNIDLHNIRQIAETGVDRISVGSLTKHLKAADLSMRVQLIN